MAGHVVSQARQGDHTLLTVRRRGQIKREQLLVNRIIVCTGIPLSYGESREPLLIRLQQRGLLKADPLGLGAACSQTGALLNANGAPQAGLYTIGSPRKGDLWESVAVPELRVQARDLAHQIMRTWEQRYRALPPIDSTKTLEQPQVRGVESPSAHVRQLFDPETSTYTYLIADPVSGDAALVDPVLEHLERDLQLIHELKLQLRLCLETHLHADHVTAAGQLRRRSGCRLLVPADPGIINADQLLVGGERLTLGSLQSDVIATPGHTAHHVAYRLGDTHLFSGDALLIRGCGRTDFQNGDAGQLYDSLQTLLNLLQTMEVYPCHDYQDRRSSTIKEERLYNPRLVGRSREDFIELMAAQRLAPPKRLHDALPANQHLGDLYPVAESGAENAMQLLEREKANETELANREIYNEFLGMFI